MSHYYGGPPGDPQQPSSRPPFPGPGFQPSTSQLPAIDRNPKAVRLIKNGRFEFGTITQFSVALCWDGHGVVSLSKAASLSAGDPQQPNEPASQFKLDLLLFVVDAATGKVLDDDAFVFYDRRVFQPRDDRPPIIQLDDGEIAHLDIARLPQGHKIIVGASISGPNETKTFGAIKSAKICIVGPYGTVAEHHLNEEDKTMTAVIFGEVTFHHRNGWYFHANPAAFADISTMAGVLGVNDLRGLTRFL